VRYDYSNFWSFWCRKRSCIKSPLELDSKFEIAVTCTTRKPREIEKDGVDYFSLMKTNLEK